VSSASLKNSLKALRGSDSFWRMLSTARLMSKGNWINWDKAWDLVNNTHK
jgi:hypothetical protein